MNSLRATVVSVQQVGLLAQVSLEVSGQPMRALMVDIDAFAPLEKGTLVQVLFKESEVLIATPHSTVSAANAFVCPVAWVNQGELVSEVGFAFGEDEVVSMITTASLKRLDVAVGKSFMWFVKANEVTLQKVKHVR
ncbi:hypothetical protein JWV37_10150 [Sulfurospirillum sp. T05]|uniref:Uncharacterized protein n=1 Tax=Sulfurospirillum tamanense TaxID=2813362 RepID=A0ABS2WU01_9BACT|nr:hypothetical protein [Sulfurospirillum tamanensis]MBN2965144.1 hypothetical protein [Sulfurospirillum tamanensis]